MVRGPTLNDRIDEPEGGRGVTDVVAAADLQTWEAEMRDGGIARVIYSASRGEGWFLADGMTPLGRAGGRLATADLRPAGGAGAVAEPRRSCAAPPRRG